jgi:hypothetical protein
MSIPSSLAAFCNLLILSASSVAHSRSVILMFRLANDADDNDVTGVLAGMSESRQYTAMVHLTQTPKYGS